jgi:hypothetical protein
VDVRPKYGGKKAVLPIVRLPKDWKRKFDSKRAKDEAERKKEYDRVKEVRKKAAVEKKAAPVSVTRGSTPLATPANFTLPDFSKPPPSTPTSSSAGSIPVLPSSSGSTPLSSVSLMKKKPPSLFSIKFPDKVKPRFPIVIPKNIAVKPVPKLVPPPTNPGIFTRPPPDIVTTTTNKAPKVVAPVAVNTQADIVVATPKPNTPGHAPSAFSARGGGRRTLLPGQEPTRPVWSDRPGRTSAWWCRVQDCNGMNWYPSDTCSYCFTPRNSFLIRENFCLKRKLEAAERELKSMKQARFVVASKEGDINDNTSKGQ